MEKNLAVRASKAFGTVGVVNMARINVVEQAHRQMVARIGNAATTIRIMDAQAECPSMSLGDATVYAFCKVIEQMDMSTMNTRELRDGFREDLGLATDIENNRKASEAVHDALRARLTALEERVFRPSLLKRMFRAVFRNW